MSGVATAELLVVDDEPDLVEVLEHFLTSAGFKVAKAASVAEAKSHIDKNKYTLIVCDILLGDSRHGGLEVLDHANSHSTPVVLISGNADFETLKQAINKGAKFFLEKPFDTNLLTKVVKELVSPKSDMLKKISAMADRHQLTPREREVFEFLSRGLSNKEIADALGTSERTIKAHLSSIFKKCSVESRSELLSVLLAA